MRCRDFRVRLQHQLDHRLDPQSDGVLSEHVRQCARCRQLMRAQARLMEALGGLTASDLPGVGARSTAGSRRWASPWVAVAAAAALLVGYFMGPDLTHRWQAGTGMPRQTPAPAAESSLAETPRETPPTALAEDEASGGELHDQQPVPDQALPSGPSLAQFPPPGQSLEGVEPVGPTRVLAWDATPVLGTATQSLSELQSAISGKMAAHPWLQVVSDPFQPLAWSMHSAFNLLRRSLPRTDADELSPPQA